MPNPEGLDLSLVIPLFDEEESLPELMAWIHRVVEAEGLRYEVLFVDDGSRDKSWQVIQDLRKQFPAIRGVRFRRNYGKSAGLQTAFERAKGHVVITMDADLQDSPDEIPALYKMITVDGYDLVSGWKQVRHDPISKTIPSKLFNWATRKVTGIHLHDFNCGLKAYRNDVIKSIDVYGEMHRYIPFLAKSAGFSKIGEKVVEHRARKYGHSKFGLERFINGFLDLLSVNLVMRYGKRPMHFFGPLGILCFLLGFFITVYVIGNKLWLIAAGVPHRDVVDQPLFYLALVALIVGVQLFLAGFVGDLVVRANPERNQYLIAEDTGV
jgi:glycosyltransferase involved in cell wall biosynthesis